MADTPKPKGSNSNRVEIASAGIEDGVINLTERLQQGSGAKLDDNLRLLEALLFAAVEPIETETLRERMPDNVDVGTLLARLTQDYAGRGINLVRVAEKWRFQTASDLAHDLVDIKETRRKLGNAALETLAIIAYHQPATRAEIEDVRGVAVSKGTIDILMELGWVRMRGRRRTPGRPVTYGTTDGFLAHFNLETLRDLPGHDDLKAAGLLDPRLPHDFEIPTPKEILGADDDLDPMEDEEQPEFFVDFMSDDDNEDKAE